MKASTALTLAFLALTTTFAARAHADVAPPLPESIECARGAIGAVPTLPEGTLDERGRPMRPWPYCAATTCTSHADCTGGRMCSTEDVGLCMEDHTVIEGVVVRQARERGCEPDGTCLNLQATCERARRCVSAQLSPTLTAPPPPPPSTALAPTPTPQPTSAATEAAPASTGAFGCHAAPASSSMSLAWLAPLALLAMRRRRS